MTNAILMWLLFCVHEGIPLSKNTTQLTLHLYGASPFCYTSEVGSNFSSWQERIPGTVECEYDLPASTKVKRLPSSLQQLDTTCQLRYNIGVGYGNSDDYPRAYYYLKSYAELCYDSYRSWQVFGDLMGVVQFLSADKSRFTEFREWLKSVLWLNTTDPRWYCECVHAILFTYQWDEAAQGVDANAAVAVARYLEQSKRCQMDSAWLYSSDSAERADQRQHWLDTCRAHGHDTTVFKEDTTLPSLHSLGLDILLGQSGVAGESSEHDFDELYATENPAWKSTTIVFVNSHSEYAAFQVFDVMGRIVHGDYKGSVLPPGKHEFQVDCQNWSAGAYFARVSTISGARTIRILKE